MYGTVALGILLPFAGTTLGSAMVFLLKKEINPKLQKLLLGFASGVMIAASIWSLILPSAELAAAQGVAEWLPAAIGFVSGMLALLLLDTFVPHQHIDSDIPEGSKSSLGKTKLLMLSVTLHNVPEGMAVGAVFARAYSVRSGCDACGGVFSFDRYCFAEFSRGRYYFHAA